MHRHFTAEPQAFRDELRELPRSALMGEQERALA